MAHGVAADASFAGDSVIVLVVQRAGGALGGAGAHPGTSELESWQERWIEPQPLIASAVNESGFFRFRVEVSGR